MITTIFLIPLVYDDSWEMQMVEPGRRVVPVAYNHNPRPLSDPRSLTVTTNMTRLPRAIVSLDHKGILGDRLVRWGQDPYDHRIYVSDWGDATTFLRGNPGTTQSPEK